MTATVRYVCRECAATWKRKVAQRSPQPLERAFSAVCPACRERRRKSASEAKKGFRSEGDLR